MTEPTTVRLHNIDPNRSQLSLHLLWPVAKTQPRLRRGVSMLPIRIVPGGYYDICKELSVDLEDARTLARSPEVVAHQNGNRLLVREFPPSDTQLAAEAKIEAQARDAAEKTTALNPPDPPGAVPAGVDLEMAGLPLDTPRMTGLPTAVSPVADADAVEDFGTPATEEILDMGTDLETASSGEPTMDWSAKQLKKYAEEHEIALEGAVSKTQILKAIRKGLSSR